MNMFFGGLVGNVWDFAFKTLILEILGSFGDDEIDGLVGISRGVDFHDDC